MVSIDLSILGAEPARYRAYSDAIRQEYAHVPDELFRKGRTSVLEQLLLAEPLFPDARFRAAFERQARSNMSAEIDRLSASID
jgi:predicted metal-dependent HD superfamily phosphohydrolase